MDIFQRCSLGVMHLGRLCTKSDTLQEEGSPVNGHIRPPDGPLVYHSAIAYWTHFVLGVVTGYLRPAVAHESLLFHEHRMWFLFQGKSRT